MELIWNLFGTYLEFIWNLFGTYLESIWNLFGTYLESIWNKKHKSSTIVLRSGKKTSTFAALLFTEAAIVPQIPTAHHLFIMPKVIGDLRLYDLDELSDLLGMHKKSLTDKYIKTGVIRARKFGVRWYVPEDALKEYFAEKEELLTPIIHTPLQSAQRQRSHATKHL